MMAKFFSFALLVAVVASSSVFATESSEQNVEQQKPEVEVVAEAEASVE